MIKKLDCRIDFLKRSIFLNKVIKVLNWTNTWADNKTDMEISNRVDTKGSNRMGMIMGLGFEDKIIAELESKVDIRISYKLNLFIFANNHTKNLLFYNLANDLANLFGNLLSTSIDFCSFLVISIFFFDFAIFNGINSSKLLDFISFDSPATWNLDNNFAFYHWLFVYLIIKPSINVVLTNFSHFSFNSIKIE